MDGWMDEQGVKNTQIEGRGKSKKSVSLLVSGKEAHCSGPPTTFVPGQWVPGPSQWRQPSVQRNSYLGPQAWIEVRLPPLPVHAPRLGSGPRGRPQIAEPCGTGRGSPGVRSGPPSLGGRGIRVSERADPFLGLRKSKAPAFLRESAEEPVCKSRAWGHLSTRAFWNGTREPAQAYL